MPLGLGYRFHTHRAVLITQRDTGQKRQILWGLGFRCCALQRCHDMPGSPDSAVLTGFKHVCSDPSASSPLFHGPISDGRGEL